MATGYLPLLRTRHALRLLTGTLVGRLPNATAALAIVLFTRAHGGDFTLAGALSAVYGLGNAVGQPVLGRLVDKRGQPGVLLGGAVVSAAATTLFALTGPRPLPVACAAMAVAGLAAPPLEGALRALWPSVLGGRQEQVHAAYALDAAAQEVMFAVGPLLVTLIVAAASTAAALVTLALVGVAGTLCVVTSGPSRRWRAGERDAHWLGPLRSRGLLTLLGSLFFVGLALGSIAVAAVAYADAHGGGMVSSWLLSALGLGALVGGVTYGTRTWAGVPERRLRLLMLALAVSYLPLVADAPVAVMTALSALAGLFLAPVLACAFVVVDRHAPAGTVTEAFSWLVTAFGVGASVGTAAAGPAAQYGAARAAFAVAGAGGTVALLVLSAGSRFLAAPNLRQRKENDRTVPAEPGFSSSHQA
ncbi:MFS transporter [Streptomyces sp. ICBB 8177]|uniref:MFS transporter n=1 Tax=Streptomyces sp. ICBB 8177 TaxID=563922 RepID=UPI000D682647|nr:MFS transporter [Streptomyces sp. ICBB 8177]PWI41983.1 MFS transporter [Streptomyces sp. ICBB 8177]